MFKSIIQAPLRVQEYGLKTFQKWIMRYYITQYAIFFESRVAGEMAEWSNAAASKAVILRK